MSSFLEVEANVRAAQGQPAAGDVFQSRRADDGSVAAVLCDGTGHGLEANVAATLASTMALEYVASEIPLRRIVPMMMDALPLTPDGIPFSTFTLVRIRPSGAGEIAEFNNPPAVIFRGAGPFALRRTPFSFEELRGASRAVYAHAAYPPPTIATFRLRLGDRLVFTSDGVTQAGLGSHAFPMGWGEKNVTAFLSAKLVEDRSITSDRLAPYLTAAAVEHDGGLPVDDITTAVVGLREARILQVLTGPPFDRTKDHAYAAAILTPGVKSVVCGGSTAKIVSRELGRPIVVPREELDPDVPVTSRLEGTEIVTEGCLTLSKLLEYLRTGTAPARRNGATVLRELMLASDRIDFLVGTGINPAHQDPNLPQELTIRRTLVGRLSEVLERKYFKAVTATYF